MKQHDRQRFTASLSFLLFLVCLICLLCLLAACGQGRSPNPNTTVGSTVTTQRTSQNTPAPNKTTSVVSTSPVPSTQTNCPVSGRARAIITAPLALVPHQTIVYVLNEGPFNNPALAILRRYDVTTGVKTDILSLHWREQIVVDCE